MVAATEKLHRLVNEWDHTTITSAELLWRAAKILAAVERQELKDKVRDEKRQQNPHRSR
jgi:hypothetical protein